MFINQLIIALAVLFIFLEIKNFLFSGRRFKNTQMELRINCNGEEYEIQQAVESALYIKHNYLKNLRIILKTRPNIDGSLKKQIENQYEIELIE